MSDLKKWLKERLSEKSTRIAIATALANVTGYLINPAYMDLLAGLSIALLSGTAFATKEAK